MTDGEYVLDLARLLVELDDETLTTKNLTACIFALSAKSGLSPGQFLAEFAEKLPGYESWYEDFLPEIADVPDDYESIGED